MCWKDWGFVTKMQQLWGAVHVLSGDAGSQWKFSWVPWVSLRKPWGTKEMKILIYLKRETKEWKVKGKNRRKEGRKEEREEGRNERRNERRKKICREWVRKKKRGKNPLVSPDNYRLFLQQQIYNTYFSSCIPALVVQPIRGLTKGLVNSISFGFSG